MSELQELPQGWVSAGLGDFTTIIGGSTPSRGETRYFGGGIIWLTPTEIPKETVTIITKSRETLTEEGVKNSSVRLIPTGSVLLTSRASIGYVAIAGVPVTTNQGFASFILSHDLNPKYLGWWLRSQKKNLEDLAGGTTFKEISKATLKDVQVPLAPLPEQQRIVEALEQQLSRLDAGVVALRSTQQKLKRYRASVLKAAIEGKLTQEWRKSHPEVEPASELLKRILQERRAKWEKRQIAKGRDLQKVGYEEPAGPDVKGLPELPEDWGWATIEQISVLVTDGDHNPPARVPIGIPHLTARNIVDSQILLANCTYITKESAERVFKRYKPLTGDLIITCVGTIGRTAIVPNDIIFSPDRNLAAVRPVLGFNFTKYLEYCILSPNIQINIGSVSGSTAQPHLYLTDLRALSINLPPLAEQEQIVSLVEERLSIVATLESTIEQVLKRAERMRQSILHRAFTGKLVAQDPNDEPASVLLERIRREREEATTPQKLKQLVYKANGKSSRKRVAESTQPYLLVDVPDPEPVDAQATTQGGLWD